MPFMFVSHCAVVLLVFVGTNVWSVGLSVVGSRSDILRGFVKRGAFGPVG